MAGTQCASCGKPLNDAFYNRETSTVQTGRSEHQRLRAGMHVNTGRTVHYATRSRLICFGCRVRRLFQLVLMLGVLGGAGYAWSLIHPAPTSRHAASVASPESVLDAFGSVSSSAADDGTTGRSDRGRADETPTSAAGSDSRRDARAELRAEIIASPQSVERVARAVDHAAADGEAERWHYRGLHGYAVPSAADSGGCRMVQVSIDGGDQAEPIRRCPASNAGAL